MHDSLSLDSDRACGAYASYWYRIGGGRAGGGEGGGVYGGSHNQRHEQWHAIMSGRRSRRRHRPSAPVIGLGGSGGGGSSRKFNAPGGGGGGEIAMERLRRQSTGTCFIPGDLKADDDFVADRDEPEYMFPTWF